MIVDLLATAILAAVPFAVGSVIGYRLASYRLPLLVVTGVPAAYFVTNLLVALTRQRLDETLVLGIPLGMSPVFIMILTAVTAGPFVGIAVGSWWRER